MTTAAPSSSAPVLPALHETTGLDTLAAAATVQSAPAKGQSIVHVVGQVTDEVLASLRASLQACAAHGVETCVVLIDRERHRYCLVHLDESAELFLVAPVRNPLSQWRAVARTIDALLHGEPPQAVHLHGLLPCAVGVLALHRARMQVPVYFSLYGFRTLNRVGRAAARALARWRKLLQGAQPAAITYVPREERALQIWSTSGLHKSPGDGLRFPAPRHESNQPLVLSGGHDLGFKSIKTFSQLAVLLGGGENRIGFRWIGRVAGEEERHLHAAGVRVLGTDDKDHALHLTSGWLYVAPDVAEGFPVTLVSAMALGLPCVAMDCEQHRQVISHGLTGYLCSNVPDFLACISALLRDAALREHMGREARQQAVLRFNAESFGKRLFAAYSLGALAGNGTTAMRGKS
jgi:glycosyltransferase involved in cell wall biosynthesis